MTGLSFRATSKPPLGLAGKLFASLFFLFFLGMGLMFVWLVAREAFAGLRTWTWQKTACQVVSSEVRETDRTGRHTGKFYPQVNYRYTFNGRTFDSQTITPQAATHSDYRKAAQLIEPYQTGPNAACYVNPANPTEAVLERGSLLFPFLVLFPMIFVTIGAGGIYGTWRRKPAEEDRPRPISEPAGTRVGRGAVAAFFSIFLIVGIGAFYAMFLRPVFKVVAAGRWPAVPCVVLSSELTRHSEEHGDTYSVNILYSYAFNGRELKANRYSFMGGSSSGYSGKRAVVSRHPPGRETVCYVNPSDPTEAVLERGFTPEMWFGLMPLLFVAAGAGGLRFALTKGRQQAVLFSGIDQAVQSARSGTGTLPPLRQTEVAEMAMLKPKTSPLGKLLIMTVIALFWNGIVSVFLAQVVRGWRSGHMVWFLAIFMIPFVLIGLGLIVGVLYSFLALFNPRPRLRVTPGAVPLGGAIEVEWEIRGRVEPLRSLTIRLEGREQATYRRGTNTATDKSVFASVEIAAVTTRPEMRSGTRVVTIPAGLMHSFAAEHNQIVWMICLRGDIPRWPDVIEEFPLTVLPASRSTALRS